MQLAYSYCPRVCTQNTRRHWDVVEICYMTLYTQRPQENHKGYVNAATTSNGFSLYIHHVQARL